MKLVQADRHRPHLTNHQWSQGTIPNILGMIYSAVGELQNQNCTEFGIYEISDKYDLMTEEHCWHIIIFGFKS